MHLIAENLTVHRGGEMVIDNISFARSSGEALIVRGENGSGKSTLLRAIADLLPLESGGLTLSGRDPEFADTPIPGLCHYLGHDNSMKPALSVGENLTFWREFAGFPHLDIGEALDMVGLAGLFDIPFAHLSTGQRRRASIARLLVSYRPIWLLDEPTSGLDAASEAQFCALMQTHLDDEGIIIAATHVPLDISNASVLDLGVPR